MSCGQKPGEGGLSACLKVQRASRPAVSKSELPSPLEASLQRNSWQWNKHSGLCEPVPSHTHALVHADRGRTGLHTAYAFLSSSVNPSSPLYVGIVRTKLPQAVGRCPERTVGRPVTGLGCRSVGQGNVLRHVFLHSGEIGTAAKGPDPPRVCK